MRTALTLLYAVCLLAGTAHASEDEASPTAKQASAKQASAQQEASAEQASTQDATLDVAAILANPLTEDDYRETSNCLRIRAIDDVEILDDNVVLFHGRRRELWLNQLSSQCLGLEPDMVVNLHSFGGTICRLDRFRGRHHFQPLVPITAECRLGTFETIDEFQAEALRAAVAEHRRVAGMVEKTKRSRRDARSGKAGKE